MSKYFFWDKKTLNNFEDSEINISFNNGYVFTREHRGSMYQTRILRVNLSLFELNSENRRIINKTTDLKMLVNTLPLDLKDYNWKIHKLGKNFYENKLNLKNTFSAYKIKELVIDGSKSNFNCLLKFYSNDKIMGYVICYKNNELIQYAYPFYDYVNFPNNYGMGMMLKALIYAKNEGLKYVYLGSVTRPEDTYKLQFDGLEWFDGKSWQIGKLDELKQILLK